MSGLRNDFKYRNTTQEEREELITKRAMTQRTIKDLKNKIENVKLDIFTNNKRINDLRKINRSKQDLIVKIEFQIKKILTGDDENK